MTLLVDTSVWSHAFRRDGQTDLPEVSALRRAMDGDDIIITTGLILQELLQGFHGPKSRDQLVERFADLPFLTPDRKDHIEAAYLRNTCRRSGVQIETIDALLAQLCIRYELTLLTTDRDFLNAAEYIPLRIWNADS
jgi:predicted nucleic acid-binding protein